MTTDRMDGNGFSRTVYFFFTAGDNSCKIILVVYNAIMSKFDKFFFHFNDVLLRALLSLSQLPPLVFRILRFLDKPLKMFVDIFWSDRFFVVVLTSNLFLNCVSIPIPILIPRLQFKLKFEVYYRELSYAFNIMKKKDPVNPGVTIFFLSRFLLHSSF